MARSLVDDIALENLHQSLLVALRSGTRAMVRRRAARLRRGRRPDRPGRRKMPAMMRGADGLHLTLTRRQVELIRTLVRGPIFSEPEGGAP